MGILSCDEITFPKEPNVGFVIVKIIGFTSLIIIRLDTHVAEVGIWELESCPLDFS
jgi:hypothetical protein